MSDKADSELFSYKFDGTVASADFQLSLDFFKRDVNFNQQFLQISGVQKNLQYKAFDTDYSGYLGIAPWTADPARKE
jgi:hypothetical protein